MKEKIILKSMHPELYPDLEIECRVIENSKIGEYLENIAEEKKFVAYKTGRVEAREGIEGERVKTILKTVIDGKEYILHEEENTVKKDEKGVGVVITNVSSTSNEKYVVKRGKFIDTYSAESNDGKSYVPVYDPRVLTQVDENVMIETNWGEKAVCLKGSYIVTYDKSKNDYNTIEKGAFASTYTIETKNTKVLKRK